MDLFFPMSENDIDIISTIQNNTKEQFDEF